MKRLESDFQWKGRGAGKGAEQIEGSKERFRPRVFEIKFSAGEIVFRVFVYFAHRVFPRHRGFYFLRFFARITIMGKLTHAVTPRKKGRGTITYVRLSRGTRY